MMQITDVILIALFIEAIVNALKPIWCKEDGGLSVSEYVSMGVGVLMAVSCRINMLEYVVQMTYPVWVEYIFFVLTGIAIGRGTNFVYDLWGKLKEWQGGNRLTGSMDAFLDGIDSGKLTDNQLRAILIQCGASMRDIGDCQTRAELEKLLDRYAVEAADPPRQGGVE